MPSELETAGELTVEDIPQSQEATGSGEFNLQCGYIEYVIPETITTPASGLRYNNCPNSDNGATLGVGDNSCCMPRPARVEEYPYDGTGLGVNGPDGVDPGPVCSNSLITVTFSGDIDEDTLPNNIIVARGQVGAVGSCNGAEETDVTDLVQTTLAMNDAPFGGLPWWQRLWRGIANFFVRIFGSFAYASITNDLLVDAWCSGGVRVVPQVSRLYDESGAVASTKVTLELQEAMATNTTYAVFLRGGTLGISDVNGVGIGNPDRPGRDDSWLFYVGNEICDLDSVAVEPDSHLFRTPNQTDRDDDDDVPNNAEDFTATASAADGQLLSSIPGVYDWQWSWGPTSDSISNAIVDIPSDPATNQQSAMRIRSKMWRAQLRPMPTRQLCRYDPYRHRTQSAGPGVFRQYRTHRALLRQSLAAGW